MRCRHAMGEAMMRPFTALPLMTLTLALPLVLTACAADTSDYPSLARRAVERSLPATGTAPQASPPAPAAALPPGADLSARLARLTEQAGKAHGAFDSRLGKAQRAVASGSGSARGSEGWALASVALADLESARSEAMIALADLDQLYAAARIDGTESKAIADARDRVMGWIGEEDRALAALRGQLGG